MPPAESVVEEITKLVRGGFLDRAQIVEVMCEELHAPGELDEAEVAAVTVRLIADHESSMATWPATTDCDRLAEAFDALHRRGIIALENAGLTQSDGYELFVEVLARVSTPNDIAGYCFYHGQDVDNALDGHGLHLAFGPRHPEDEDTKGADIGRTIVEELDASGLASVWGGSFKERILVTPFDWKRR
jgi:hypothetical protein